MTRNKAPPQQETMFGAFEQAAFERDTAELPNTIEGAVAVLRGIIERYNQASLTGDQAAKEAARALARQLAIKLNEGTSCGIKIRGGVCDQLAAATRAPEGEVPLWGQAGEFIVTVRGCDVRIEWDGLYGICEIGFSAHAVSADAPFISETGYRSFLLTHRSDVTGGSEPVADFVRSIIENHIDAELRGHLVPIAPDYRDRLARHGSDGPADTEEARP